MGLGMCVLAAPEIVVGAVVVTGIVVVGFAIKEALENEKRSRPQVRPVPEARPEPKPRPVPVTKSALPEQKPKPDPKGPDFPPIKPSETLEGDRNRCEPVPRPYHRGGNKLHDTCADRIPGNSFPGGDVLVNGKDFDALQLATRTLWEVKTDNFDTYPPDLRRIVLDEQVLELQYEHALALACRFGFRVGVRSPAHKIALELADPELKGLIEVMDWC
jgi:hypothetical protein